MKKSKFTLMIIAAGLSFWILDVIIDEIFFAKRPFYEGLTFNLPPHEIYMNLTTIVAIFAFGLLTMRYATRLNESEGRYRQLFDNVEDAIFVHSSGTTGSLGKLVEVNAAGVQNLGYAREELLQLSLADLTIPQKFPDLSAVMNQLLADKHVLFEADQVAKDGRRIPVEIKAHLFNLEGSTKVLAIARDITERRQAQAEIWQAQAELEKRVEERTAELSQANQALRESENQLHLLTARLLNAEEKERRRISLELHDEMGQALTLLKFQIGSMTKKLGKTESEVRDECAALVLQIDEIIENVRRLSRDLSPAVLEELGLSSALAYLLEEFHQYHPSVSFTDNIDQIDDSFSQQTQIYIYRIIQESLTNIFKYAQATKVGVTAQKQDGQVLFVVQDNGKGFEVDQVLVKDGAPKGLGLAAMRERVWMVGGKLHIWSQKGQGTRINFTIPIEGVGADGFAI